MSTAIAERPPPTPSASAGRTQMPKLAHARPSGPELAGSLVLTLLSIVTAIGFCRLFPDWAYLRSMLVVVIGAHAAATLLRAARVPGWIALPVGLAVVLELLAFVYYRDTTRLLLPSADTIDLLRSDLRLVWHQFPLAVAPVPSEGSFAVASAGALAVCAVVADGFAFRAYGRAEAVVPTGLAFVFTAALGADRNRVAVSALWVATALLTVAVLRFSHGRDESVWVGGRRRTLGTVLPAALVCAGIAGLGAAIAAPLLPGAGQKALLDTRNRSEVTHVVSPLVDIRSRLVNQAYLELFSVESAQPEYWRVSGLSRFDGTRWTPANEDLTPAESVLVPPADSATPLEQTVTIRALTGNLLPVAYSPYRSRTPGLYFAPEAQAVLLPGDGYTEGDAFSMVSAVSNPTADQLRAASTGNYPSPQDVALPASIPEEVVDLAREIAAGASTPYDQALALQNWFRDNFTYDTKVQAGHSNDAMRNFLRIRRGYCEQFAGTFAAMARALGLPTRVAVGYTQGQLLSDGRYHVSGRHAHAWAEVWFDGYGWVLFEPTPGRGAPGAEDHTGVAPEQDSSTGTGGGTGDAAPPVTAAPARPTVPPFEQAGGRNGATTSVPALGPAAAPGASPWPWIILLAIAGVFAWLVVVPRAARRLAAHRGSPEERVSAAWQRSCDILQLAGAPPVGGMTPAEYAREAELSTGVDRRVSGEIARYVTRAVYSPVALDPDAAHRCEQLHVEIHEIVRERLPWSQRIREHLDPREARWLHA